MSNFSTLITTSKGHGLVAKILAGELATEPQTPFTRIVTSSEVYQVTQIEALTTLMDIEQETLVSAVTKQNQTTIEIHGGMDNSSLTVGYRLNTVGVFFCDPDDGLEYLFGAAVHVPIPEEPSADFIFPFNGVTTTAIMFDLLTNIGNAENISINVDPTATVTVKTLLIHNSDPQAHENRFAPIISDVEALKTKVSSLFGFVISDAVLTHADLLLLDTGDMAEGTLILVSVDETRGRETTLYEWVDGNWLFLRVFDIDINNFVQKDIFDAFQQDVDARFAGVVQKSTGFIDLPVAALPPSIVSAAVSILIEGSIVYFNVTYAPANGVQVPADTQIIFPCPILSGSGVVAERQFIRGASWGAPGFTEVNARIHIREGDTSWLQIMSSPTFTSSTGVTFPLIVANLI